MVANVLIEHFIAGGPIMWPILIAGVVSVAVVGERSCWWWRESRKRDPLTLEKLFAALENGDFQEARNLSKNSEDPIIRVIFHGMNHFHSSLQGALQVAAGVEIQKAGRFLTVMDTLVTLAPLLGLLGTVSGIFHTFISLGAATVEGATGAITGGIGEALIATMCGLAIAIFALIPFNFFNRKLAQLEFDLETAATNVEIMVTAAKHKGIDTIEFRGKDPPPR
jgi:biopolymer transport protein ExbB